MSFFSIHTLATAPEAARTPLQGIRSKSRIAAAVAAVAMLTSVAGATSALGAETRIYTVTITNLTKYQFLTPALVTTHKGNVDLFTVGKVASFELQEIAENGNLVPMRERIENSRDFDDLVVQTGNTGPVAPGETITFDISGAPPFNFLSWASMLVCTNDGFTGIDSLKLPNRVGQSVTTYLDAYDAGTEINTELWVDLVPSCGALTDQPQVGGTRETDPALAEGGVVHHHPGILGVGDLDPAINDWVNPVAEITVERTGWKILPGITEE
jgi:hypothetical protein